MKFSFDHLIRANLRRKSALDPREFGVPWILKIAVNGEQLRRLKPIQGFALVKLSKEEIPNYLFDFQILGWIESSPRGTELHGVFFYEILWFV